MQRRSNAAGRSRRATKDGHMDMRLTASTTKLTYHDFVSFPDDGRRHELIDGEHYVTPSPITRHQRVLGRLFAALFQYCDANPIGEVFQARFDVVFSMFDVVEPDLLVVMADQADIVTDKHVRGAPALVVEVLSPGTRRHDEGIKRKLYDRSGVREYWVVDPERDVITVRRRTVDGRLTQAAVLARADAQVLTSPLFPGFSMALGTLFK
jgi:Uma2 family endonuclease